MHECEECDGSGVVEVMTCGTSRCKCDGFSGGCSETDPCDCEEDERE